MKILLVEDDTALRSALEELLQREHYELISAASATAAQSKIHLGADMVMRM